MPAGRVGAEPLAVHAAVHAGDPHQLRRRLAAPLSPLPSGTSVKIGTMPAYVDSCADGHPTQRADSKRGLTLGVTAAGPSTGGVAAARHAQPRANVVPRHSGTSHAGAGAGAARTLASPAPAAVAVHRRPLARLLRLVHAHPQERRHAVAGACRCLRAARPLPRPAPKGRGCQNQGPPSSQV